MTKRGPDDFGVTPGDIEVARRRIAGRVVRTPLIHSRPLTKMTGTDVHLKLECLQGTGSFKLRGATNRILSLPGEDRARGVIAVSSGNHGRAVAAVACGLGIGAVICLGRGVPTHKVEGIRSWGAEVLIAGEDYEEAAVAAARIALDRGLTFIHPFDDPLVIAGQGTIGLEIAEDLDGVDTVLVPISGGGMIAGIALAMKSADPSIRVVGVCMERGAAMHESLRAGRIVGVSEEPTLADALTGGLGDDNRHSFRMCRALVDETVTVSEEEIAEAMSFMLWSHALVVEGSGAVGIAAVRAGRATARRRMAIVVSGSNVDIARLLAIAGDGPPGGAGR